MHPHKSKRFHFKPEMEIPAIGDFQIFVPKKKRLHRECVRRREEEREIW